MRQAYYIKPLIWEIGLHEGGRASGIRGRSYSVYQCKLTLGWFLATWQRPESGPYASIDAARQAAQKDYEDELLEFLTPAN